MGGGSGLCGPHLPAAFECPGEGQVVGMLETGAGGQTLGDAGDAEGGVIDKETLAEVGGGRLAFDIAAQGQDHLADVLRQDPVEQGIDAQVLGADPIEGAEASAEDVITATEGLGLFDTQDVEGTLDNAEDPIGPGGLGAEATGLDLREGTAMAAEPDTVAGLEDGV